MGVFLILRSETFAVATCKGSGLLGNFSLPKSSRPELNAAALSLRESAFKSFSVIGSSNEAISSVEGTDRFSTTINSCQINREVKFFCSCARFASSCCR